MVVGDLSNLGEVEQINLSEKIVNDDPKWQEAYYVLANYKTEQCRRPPRLCRQGYACPQFHNPKDRRRNPKKCKYKYVLNYCLPLLIVIQYKSEILVVRA